MEWYFAIVFTILLQHDVGVEASSRHRDVEAMLRELRGILRDVAQTDDSVNHVEAPSDPVITTFGGNAGGTSCVFPFSYNDKSHSTCITTNNNGILWCATTADYSADGQWGNCEAIATFGGNSDDGSMCRFPFDYNGVSYSECTTQDNEDILWCATTSDGKWGNCRAIPTSGGNDDGRVCDFPFTYRGQEYSSCTTDSSVGVPWCATTREYDTDGKWGYCGANVPTIGGNANGSFCEFPYIYGGESYSLCTTAGNDDVPWCATTANYDDDGKWGNCRVGGCGYRPIVQSGDRIVGGFDAIYGAFPWTAAMPYKVSGTYSRWCGGTIISDRWILTAAHCFWGDSASEYLASIGNHKFSITDKYEQFLDLELLITHPQYKGSPYDYDIALARVDGRIYFNNYSQPACLPDPDATNIYKPGEMAIISGWGGLQQGASGPDQLNAALVPLVDQGWCSNRFSQLTERMVCAGYLEGGVDTCQGDSGGPMVQNISNVYTVTGVTSWGYGCAQAESPGVYARVQELLQWINETIAANP